MFPVIHGILAQAQGGDSCVYPLDATPDQLALLDAAAFDLNDECGHSLSVSDYSSSQHVVALSKEVMDALMSGAQEVPARQAFPPDAHRHVALDFRLQFAAQRTGGGSGALPRSRLTTLNLDQSSIAEVAAVFDGNDISLQVADEDGVHELYRIDADETLDDLVSILFDTQEKKYKVFAAAEESGWRNYSGQGALTCWVETNSNFSITTGFDLEMHGAEPVWRADYPDGVVGADGKAIPKPQDITSEVVFIPGVIDSAEGLVVYADQDGPQPVGTMVDNSQWEIGYFWTVIQGQGGFVLSLRDAGLVISPTNAELYINDEFISDDFQIDRSGEILIIGFATEQKPMVAGEVCTLKVKFIY